MKKIALLIAIVILIKLCPSNDGVKFGGATGNYSFYLGSASSTCEIVTVDAESADEVKKNLNNVCGESLSTTDGDYIRKKITEYGATFLFEENVDGTTVRYYYSPEIGGGKTVNGKKVNLQTAESENGCYTIGTPLIFGGF